MSLAKKLKEIKMTSFAVPILSEQAFVIHILFFNFHRQPESFLKRPIRPYHPAFGLGHPEFFYFVLARLLASFLALTLTLFVFFFPPSSILLFVIIVIIFII